MMSEIAQWIDEHGVLRCDATFRTGRPFAVTVVSDQNSPSFIGAWKEARIVGRIDGVPQFKLKLGRRTDAPAPRPA